MKLGVITDGISRDPAHAVSVRDNVGLDHTGLQVIATKEVGEFDGGFRQCIEGFKAIFGDTS